MAQRRSQLGVIRNCQIPEIDKLIAVVLESKAAEKLTLCSRGMVSHKLISAERVA